MSGPPVNPIGFRLPFEIEGKAEPEIVQALHYHDDGLVDLNQAVASIKSQMGKSSATTATTATSAAGGASATEQIIQQTVNQTNIVQPTIGFVNDQTGATAYTTQQSDYGNEIVFNSASPIAVTLNTQGTSPGIQLPWYTYISNQGSGTATLTPASGTINGGASLGVPGGSFGILFFDGTNFELLIPVSGGSGVTQLLAGAGIALSPTGGTGAVTVSASGSGGAIIVTQADVTYSRTFGTNYTAGANPLTVLVSGDFGSGTGDSLITATVNYVPVGWSATSSTISGYGPSVSFTVPAGATYSVVYGVISGSHTYSLGKWVEWTWG